MTTANGQTPADPMLIMLMIAAAITLGVNITRSMAGGHADILECVGIFFAIALSVTITVVMEGRSAKAFEALNDINDDTTVTVVRDGEFGKIARELRAANTGMTPLQEKLAKLDELHGRHRRTAVDHSVHAVRGVPAVQRLQQPRAGQRQPFANLLRNKVMIGVFALMFALQVLVVQFGGAMFRTVPLPIDMWLKIIAVGQMRG